MDGVAARSGPQGGAVGQGGVLGLVAHKVWRFSGRVGAFASGGELQGSLKENVK